MKLKYVKSQIRIWNKHVFENVFSKKSAIKQQIEDVYNHIIQNGMNEDTYVSQKSLQ